MPVVMEHTVFKLSSSQDPSKCLFLDLSICQGPCVTRQGLGRHTSSTTSDEQIHLILDIWRKSLCVLVYMFTLGFILHKRGAKIRFIGMIYRGQFSHKQNLLTIQFNLIAMQCNNLDDNDNDKDRFVINKTSKYINFDSSGIGLKF